jgi:hypothetical protein
MEEWEKQKIRDYIKCHHYIGSWLILNGKQEILERYLSQVTGTLGFFYSRDGGVLKLMRQKEFLDEFEYEAIWKLVDCLDYLLSIINLFWRDRGTNSRQVISLVYKDVAECSLLIDILEGLKKQKRTDETRVFIGKTQEIVGVYQRLKNEQIPSEKSCCLIKSALQDFHQRTAINGVF